jgi:uncharacterized protein
MEDEMARQLRPVANDDRAWPYFLLTLGWSGFFFSLAAVTSHSAAGQLPVVFHAVGGAGPLLAAILLLRMRRRPALWRDFWLGIVDTRRLTLRWAAISILLVPAGTGCAALLDIAAGGEGLRLEAAARFLIEPLAMLPFALFILVFGPLPEEPGWRGYALDRLQGRWGAVPASLILGAIWALWHVPLFFVAGSYQHGLGVGTPSFWRYLVAFLPDAILYTWIYNNTRRSTLAAILFHFMANFTGELFALTWRAELFLLLIWVMLAAAVSWLWGAATLTGSRRPASEHVPSKWRAAT